jgi:hypothetical protein
MYEIRNKHRDSEMGKNYYRNRARSLITNIIYIITDDDSNNINF